MIAILARATIRFGPRALVILIQENGVNAGADQKDRSLWKRDCADLRNVRIFQETKEDFIHFRGLPKFPNLSGQV